MRREMDTLLTNDTYEIIEWNDLPEGRKPLDSKWVFKVKVDENGNFLSRKSRITARGFTERPGVDFFEIFHPVGRGQTLKMLLAVCAHTSKKLYHVDIKGAFLHAVLPEEIYMTLPPWIEDGDQRTLVRLKKSLYGLKQAGREWYLTISKHLTGQMQFEQSKCDPCLFWSYDRSMLIFLYVDDILAMTDSESQYQGFIEGLKSAGFEIGTAELARWYLGQRISQEEGSIKIDQTAMIEALLSKYKMTDCNAAKTPMTTKRLEELKNDQSCKKDVPYRSLVGSLLYLATHSRPDIAFAVGELSKFNDKYGDEQWTAVKRVLRYLKATKDYQQIFSRDGPDQITGYCDSDWAGNWKDQGNMAAKSTTGYIFMFKGGVVVSRSRKQNTVALSSAEAEYMALAEAGQEALHLMQLYQDMTGKSQTSRIFSDNAAAIQMTENEVHQPRSKHISIRYHFIRDMVKRGQVQIDKINGQDNPADILTKPVGHIKLSEFNRKVFGKVQESAQVQ
jgi:hypothetical protein